MIVVIDDYVDIAKITQKNILKMGYKDVRVYYDPREYLYDLPKIKRKLELVITDQKMAYYTGTSLACRTRKATNNRVNVIIYSAYLAERNTDVAIWLNKPRSQHELEPFIKEYISPIKPNIFERVMSWVV